MEDKTVGFHHFLVASEDPTQRNIWLSAFQMSKDDIILNT